MVNRRTFLYVATALSSSAAAQGPLKSARKQLGITIMPEYIQSEGTPALLKNLRKMGATAVCTSPYVMEPVGDTEGAREPPVDAGAGGVRLLDRPLWGKRELHVKTAPSFTPNLDLYKGLPYQPDSPNDLTRKSGKVVQEFIHAAKDAGLEVYLQVQSAIPPGYRVQFGGPTASDKPRLPDGSLLERNVANNGSLASTGVRRYTEALLQDLCHVYSEVDGFRVDWPEYPPYFLDSLFFDFSEPARAAAERLHFDWTRMRDDSAALRQYLLHSLTDRDLQNFLAGDGGRFALATAMRRYPGFVEHLRFKSVLATEMLHGYSKTVAACGNKKLSPNLFPPPFSLVSGADFAALGDFCDSLCVKLYTMHWPMMLRFYGDELVKGNPSLSGTLLAQALVRAMDIDEQARGPLSWYHYPDPDTPHPVSSHALERKITQAKREAKCPVYALAHGYGPTTDFLSRLKTAWHASDGRVWINRYAYLSDQKIERIAGATSGA